MTVGLDLTISQILSPFKNTKLVILALLANFVLVPLFALGLISVFHVSEGVRIGIILLSLGSGSSFIPLVIKMANGHVAGSVALMVQLLIMTILLMPIAVPLLLPGASVSSWDIAKSLGFAMLAPLAIAIYIKENFSDIAVRLQPFAVKLTKISLLILFTSMGLLYSETIISNYVALPIILLFFLGTVAIGCVSGGKSNNTRMVMSVGAGLRNTPVALLVASQSFPANPMAAVIPLFLVITSVPALFLLAAIIRKKKLLSPT